VNPVEVREALYQAAKLTFPRLRDLSPEAKVAAIEDHYVACAISRQALEEAALWMQDAVKRLEDAWDAIEGYRTLIPPGDKTQKGVVAAKRQIDPKTYEGIREGKWLVDKLKTQVRRLERDEEAASRLYTMMTGG